MTTSDIINYRLINQQIARTKFKKPYEIVTWLIAMQAQEYAMAKWSIGLRLPGLIDADIEKAFNDGAILRTHLMRPTWHFVTPADIRWLLQLTGPRVHAASAFMYRKVELDSKIFKRSNDILAKTLQGGKYLTRAILKSALEKAKIPAVGFRLSYLMMYAELEGIVCSGPREGNQFTYALLDERAPAAMQKTFNREEALAEFATRYFASRGPATTRDFANWSGLTMKDANAGMATLSPDFVHQVIDGQEYVFVPTPTKINPAKADQTSFLMPDYDEYGMSYKDRSAIFNADNLTAPIRGNNPVYNRMIIVDGKIEGTWRRTIKKDKMVIEIVPFASLSKAKHLEVLNAVKRYRSFIDKEVAEGKQRKKNKTVQNKRLRN